MQIETISKNIVLQILVEEYKTDEFNVIYENGMTDYRNSNTSEEYKKKMKQRLSVQNNIYSSLSRSYNNENKIVSHFYSKDRHIPIWGIFEIITLGTFADLIKSLEFKVRNKIDTEMNNRSNSCGERIVSSENARVICAVIPTNEEKMIALDAIHLGKVNAPAEFA